jgi:hypothetical protein
MRQGRFSFLPAGESPRFLDRLAGLEQVITPDVVRQCLCETGRDGQRNCELNHEVMMWIVLAMGMFTEVPIRQVFKCSRFSRTGEATPSRFALCHGRKRLGIAPVRRLHHHVVRPVAQSCSRGAFYHGYRLMGIDSTVYDLSDTEANEAAFGRPSGGHRGPGAFPQLRKVSLVELGTHVETAFVLKPCRRNETVAVPALLKRLPADALLLTDRGFFSYSLWKNSLSRGIQLLGRVPQNSILAPLETFSDGSFVAKIYPSWQARRHDQQGIVVRAIRYTLDEPQRTGHGEKHVLITSFLDADSHPAEELILLYHQRWEQESVFDEQKTHHDPQRAHKPAQLRSQTPAGVVQEMYAMSLGHFVVRSWMHQAARTEDVDPDRLSFTGCFQVLRCRLPECDGSTVATLRTWYEALLWEMSNERCDPKRNRINPRVIKRKMSNWPKKRPQHRRPPPPTKTFRQSIVMLH